MPADKPGPRDAIDQAEARFPGTARWFGSPLWAVLRGDAFNAQQIDKALYVLESEIVAVLFEQKLREHEALPRQAQFDATTAQRLIEMAHLDSLVAAVLLRGLSDVIASPPLREQALKAYMELQVPLRHLPELAEIYPEFFSAIDQHCKHWRLRVA